MISCQELQRFPVLSKARRTQRDETPEDNVGAMWTSQHGPTPTFVNLLGAKRVNHVHSWWLFGCLDRLKGGKTSYRDGGGPR